ncbi:DUF2530 domain-containing protein [Actinomadura macra]|uniref:DUF2530 domain-containing protein n=1 Tax=Actinomadura macra TaxID=46164 RepID=UPI00082F2773|nr:DUF2530 domain-containing protein [Actinomadura macra]
MSRPRLPDPPPMRTNDVRIAAAGTAAWAVALVVLLIVDLPSGDRWWLWVCVAGIVIGLFGVWYIPRLQAGRARLEETRAAAHQGAEPEATESEATESETVEPETVKPEVR